MRLRPSFQDIRLCLDRAWDALKAGDLALLAALSADIEEQVSAIRGLQPPAPVPDLEALRVHAARNLQLLQAARDGVAAAVQKMREARRLSSEFSTYDRDGRGRMLSVGAGSVEHRA